MSDKPAEHNVTPESPLVQVPEISIPTEAIVQADLPVDKTVTPPSAQVPAEPPQPPPKTDDK